MSKYLSFVYYKGNFKLEYKCMYFSKKYFLAAQLSFVHSRPVSPRELQKNIIIQVYVIIRKVGNSVWDEAEAFPTAKNVELRGF